MEQEIQPQPLSPVPPDNKKKVITIAIVAIALIAIAGYFIFSKSSVKPTEIKTQQSSQNLDVSSWKTYQNDQYGFEVQYPDGWSVYSDEARYPESDRSDPRFSVTEPGSIKDSKCYASFIFVDAKNPDKYPYSLYSEVDKKQECQTTLDSIISTFKFIAQNQNSQKITKDTSQISGKTIKFSGEVASGQNFEKEVENNLFFRLQSEGSSWTISVGSKTSKTSVKDVGYESYKNFAGVVTPPYRGINNIYIEGWHFRNSDNSGPNEVGPKNVNAYGEVRKFYFVLNDADYQKAFDALQKMMWSYSYSEQEINEATVIHDKLSKGYGKLTIHDLKLNNLVIEKQAGIESMKFDVELVFP